MYGVPLDATTDSTHLMLSYALSAETSEIVKFFAVVATSGGKNGASPENYTPISLEVPPCGLSPQIRCRVAPLGSARGFAFFAAHNAAHCHVLSPVGSPPTLLPTDT